MTASRSTGFFESGTEPRTELSMRVVDHIAEDDVEPRQEELEIDAAKFACVHQLIEAQVDLTPDAVAIRFEGRTVTYRQLNRRANQFANYLRRLGVGPETLVAICMERSIEMIESILGVLKAGGAFVPLDPAYPRERLQFMLEDSGTRTLITQRHIGQTFKRPGLNIIYVDDCAEIQTLPYSNIKTGVDAENLAYVIYTSGSTGKPKGVQVVHRGVANFLLSMHHEPGIKAEDALLAVTTPCFDIAGLEMFLPLTVGARIELVSRQSASDGRQLLDHLNQSGITILQATPVTWRMLISAGWEKSPSLKMLCGGEAMQRDLARQLLDRGNSLWNMYGPTETTIWSTVYEVHDATEAIPIGRPIAKTHLYILDANQQPVRDGEIGELYIGGDGVARGYLNRPELTRERFIPDPFAGRGRKMYRTGDLARIRADGNVEYLGRNDHQVKIRGFRIELGEIEDEILRAEGVDQACVVPHNSGENVTLIGYAVGKSQLDCKALKETLNKRLPSHMVPSTIVQIDAFPLTPNGKIDRKALASLRIVSEQERVAPRDEIEAKLLEIWNQILQRSDIGVKDDFFELGGDSLQTVSLMVRVEKEFNVRLSLTALLPEATIEHLANAIAGTAKCQGVVPLNNVRSKSPLFCIPGSGGHCFMYREFARQLEPERSVYGVNLPGADGTSTAGKSVEEVAAQLLVEIKAIQPHGPYHLAGYSFGGLVAFEMAHQLRRANEEAAIVILFDAAGENYPRVDSAMKRLWTHTRSILTLPIKEKKAYLRERFDNLGRRLRGKKVTRVNHQDSISGVVAQISESALDAENDYKYTRYRGRVVLLRADVTPEWVGTSFDDPTNGWATVVENPLEVRHFHCTHLEMFEEPNLNYVTAYVKASLRS